MANKKIILDPSQWVLDENNRVSFRYRVITDDLNVRSAFSPVYSVEVPPIQDLFEVTSAITVESVGDQDVMRLIWSMNPQYDNMQYFIFLKKPNEQTHSFLKSTTETSFSFIVANSEAGQYSFIVTVPNTTKTALSNTILFTKTATI